MTGVRFLFRVTLRRRTIWRPRLWHIKEPQKLPPVLSPEEVKRILAMATSLKARADADPRLWLRAAGRRGSVVRLRASDISDSEQMIIRIVQSKGRKDRHVMLPAEVLARPVAAMVRRRARREQDAGVAPEQRWLFPGRDEHSASDHASVQPAVQGGGESGGAAQNALSNCSIRFAIPSQPICSRTAKTSSGDSGVAWTRQARDDGALHHAAWRPE